MNTNYYSESIISNERELSAWNLVEALELDVEAAEIRMARLQRTLSDASRRMNVLEPESKKYRRCSRLSDECRSAMNTLRAEIADKKARIDRLRKRQTSDLSAGIGIAAAIALLIAVIL